MRLANRILVLIALSGMIACAGAPAASAQVQWEVTPFAGWYIASDIYNSYYTSGPGTGRVALDNSVDYGVRITGSRGHAGLEFAYTRASSNMRLENLVVGVPRADIGQLDVDSWDLNFLGYQYTNNPNVVPFGEIGLGFSVIHPKIDSDVLLGGTAEPDSRSRFNFNFGIGTKILMNEKVGLRIEGRWRVTDTNFNTGGGVWCDAYGYCYNYSSSWYNSGEINGGLSYRFK